MRVWRVARVALAVVALVGIGASVAWAHARLMRSDPPADARLTWPPRELRLEFSEGVSPATSRIELVLPDSQRLQLRTRGDSSSAKVLIADVPPLSIAGPFKVEWRLVGPDGHAVTGRYGFTVDSIVVVPQPATDPHLAPMPRTEAHDTSTDSLFQHALRFISSASLVVIFGAIGFALFVLPAATRSGGEAFAEFQSRTERVLRSCAIAAALSLLVVAVIRLLSHGVLLSGSLAALRATDLSGLVTGTTFGRGVLLQVVATIILLTSLRPRSPRWQTLAGVAGALAISASFLGHPAAVPDVPFLAMSLDAMHVLAAGGWAGSILMLSIAMPGVTTVPGSGRIELVRNTLRAFSPVALACAVTVTITGAVGGWLQLRDPGLFLTSDYGQALIRKVAVIVVIAALGAYHWRVVQPAMANDRSVARLRLSLVIDVAFVVVALVLTAILTGTPHPSR